MFVAVDNQTNTLFSDNPYYFYNDPKSPCTPDSQSSSKGFSIFKRRNSKGHSPRVAIPEQTRLITSANLDTAATLTLGSPRGTFGILNTFPQQSFELQPIKPKRQQQQQQNSPPSSQQIASKVHQRRSHSSSSHSEIFRERFSSCSDNQTNSNNIFDNDAIFSNSGTSPSKTHHHQHHSPFQQHHTLPSAGTRRHSFGNWRPHNERVHHNSHNQTHHHLSPHKSGAGGSGGGGICGGGGGILTATADEVPQMMAPRPPVQTSNKYRGGAHKRRDNCGTMSNRTTGSTYTYNMDDILIVTAKHSERAILRANFLKNHFDKITKQRGRKPFNFLHIKIEDGPFTEEIANKYQNTALQIVILCPALLALSHSLLMSQLSAIIRVDKVLGILLDVTEEKIKEIYKAALPNYLKWRRCVIRDNDQAQISNILGIATDILGRALCQRPLCHDSGTNISRSFSSCSDGFTILPKKVKIGQNKVVAMLNEPLENNDVLKVAVEKSGELIEIRNFKCRNPYTIQFAVPESCMEISTMIEIRIEKNDKNLGGRPIKCESRLRELEQLLRSEDSPIEFMCHALGIGPTERDDLDLHLLQCFQKNMPPNFHLLSGPYQKQQSQTTPPHFITILRESSPEEYPTLLHFAARWGLTRLCMQLLECPGGDTACGIRNSSGKTPADLAEAEGHHKLARSVVSFSEFHELTTMYHYFKGINNSSKNKKEIENSVNGKNAGTKVVIEAVMLQPISPKLKPTKSPPYMDKIKAQSSEEQSSEYMEMSSGSDRETTPEMKEPKNETRAISNLNYISVESEDENLQNSITDVCKKMDIQKVVTGPEITTKELLITEPPYYASNEQNSINNSNVIIESPYQTDKFSQECSQLLENCSGTTVANDYVIQATDISQMTTNDDGNYLFHPSNIPVETEFLPSSTRMASSSRSTTYGSLKRSTSNASSSMQSNVDDELAEIMHDFKNNVLSIREVEVLVEKWKHRNDVQQSFREKQEQIDQLRKEYEHIQEQVRTQLKRDTPFDKFKKLFSRQKEQKNAALDNALDDTKSSITTSCSFKSSIRPISSSSLQSVSSSSSAGRLSTGSNCSNTSMVDSGTHSDHEERRFGCRLGSPGSLVENYLIPPPPRPLFTPNSTPGDERHHIAFPSPMSSCARLNSPTSPLSNEHYQIFPSNIPVYNSQNISHSQSNNYLNTIMEANPEPENNYQNQNGVTVQTIKLNEKSNIIYGKLNKLAPNCSSFKPSCTTANSIPTPQITSIEVEAEVYQNIASNLEIPPEEDSKNEREITTNDDNHNYMNC